MDWPALFAIRDGSDLSLRHPVQQSNLHTREVLYVWSDAAFAARTMQCKNATVITRNCFGNTKSAFGFVW